MEQRYIPQIENNVAVNKISSSMKTLVQAKFQSSFFVGNRGINLLKRSSFVTTSIGLPSKRQPAFAASAGIPDFIPSSW